MADVISLSARAKDRAGKGAARAVRRTGFIPAVIYGGKEAPVSIALEPKILNKELTRAGFFNTLIDLDVDDTKHRVLARDVQSHPVTDAPMHVDFLRVTAATTLTVAIPMLFENEEESPGLKQGGVLNIVRHDIELNCRADAIPQSLIIDLTGREVGDSIHISHVDLPDGATPAITDRDFTIATIAAPTVVIEEEIVAEEGEEGEEGVEGAEGTEGAEAAEGGDDKGEGGKA